MVENRLPAVGIEDKITGPSANGQEAGAILPGEKHCTISRRR
jgi:hypothetical protein